MYNLSENFLSFSPIFIAHTHLLSPSFPVVLHQKWHLSIFVHFTHFHFLAQLDKDNLFPLSLLFLHSPVQWSRCLPSLCLHFLASNLGLLIPSQTCSTFLFPSHVAVFKSTKKLIFLYLKRQEMFQQQRRKGMCWSILVEFLISSFVLGLKEVHAFYYLFNQTYWVLRLVWMQWYMVKHLYGIPEKPISLSASWWEDVFTNEVCWLFCYSTYVLADLDKLSLSPYTIK